LAVTFNFNTIHFIVSDKNAQEAKDLYTSVIERRCELSNLKCSYTECPDKNSFTESLQKIASNPNTSLPYLHIECHGSPNGLTFANKEKMDWDEFGNLLTEINIASRNNLFVSMAACYGGYLTLQGIKYLSKPTDQRAPVCGFIGPQSEISYDLIERGFNKYFDCLLETFDFSQALKLLNKFAFYEPGYVIKTCQFQFKEIIDHYFIMIEQLEFSSRIRFEIKIHELLMQSFRQTGKYPTTGDYLKIRHIKLDKRFYIDYLNDMAIKYFMIDLYPENRNRFSLISDIDNWDYITRMVNI